MPRQSNSLDAAMGSRDWMVKGCIAERLEDILCDFETAGFALHSIYNVMNIPQQNPLDPKQGRIVSHFIVVARKKPRRSITIDHDAEEQLDSALRTIDAMLQNLELDSHPSVDFSTMFQRIQERLSELEGRLG